VTNFGMRNIEIERSYYADTWSWKDFSRHYVVDACYVRKRRRIGLEVLI